MLKHKEWGKAYTLGIQEKTFWAGGQNEQRLHDPKTHTQ